MNRRIPILLLQICLLAHSDVFTAPTGTGDIERNRINQAGLPVFAMASYTTAVLTKGLLPGERWQIHIHPLITVDFNFAGGLSAGIALPFSLYVGFPFYGKHSLDGGMEAPYVEFGYHGSSGSISYRAGVILAPLSVYGTPFAGATANIGLIHDPVALRFELRAEFGPASILPADKWILQSLSGSSAALIVINHAVSVELALAVQQPLPAITKTALPGVIGKTGLLVRTAPFTASISISRDVWSPARPASVNTGITFLWETY